MREGETTHFPIPFFLIFVELEVTKEFVRGAFFRSVEKASSAAVAVAAQLVMVLADAAEAAAGMMSAPSMLLKL